MILPHECIENNIETYIYQHSTHSQKIYWAVLLAIQGVASEFLRTKERFRRRKTLQCNFISLKPDTFANVKETGSILQR